MIDFVHQITRLLALMESGRPGFPSDGDKWHQEIMRAKRLIANGWKSPTTFDETVELVIHAGNVGPSVKRYVVTCTHDHKSLREGDEVVIIEPPNFENCLLRVRDMTTHKMEGELDQYVHLAECIQVRELGGES